MTTFKLGWNSNSNWDKTLKLKMWQNSKYYKTQNLISQKKEVLEFLGKISAFWPTKKPPINRAIQISFVEQGGLGNI